MRNDILNNNQIINIGGIDFIISGIAGEGSSCIVYQALRETDGSKWLIKEFYPEGFEFTRDSKMHRINYSDEVKSELDRFSKTVRIMTTIYNNFDRNDTSPEDSCSCKCEGYLVMPQFEGKTLEKYDPKDKLKDLFTPILLIAKKLKRYHDGGYLYLDIKPENIFYCVGDSPRVQIIDFDSVIEEHAHDENVAIRCSSDWAAPELITGKREKICAATDVYAVGEMLYYKLTGEHSNILERTMHGNHDLKKSELLKGANPALQKKLAEFFRKTLCAAPSARYSDEELIKGLDDLIELSEEPYIIGKRWGVPEGFVGRDEDIKTVHDMLVDKKYLFIQGFGGIGKSAFAERFAEVYHDEYDIILRTKSNDPINEIKLDNYDESKFDNENSENEKRVQKWSAIQKACCRSNVLMIFDNSEKIEDSIICNELITLPCNKLFLTRKTNWHERGRKCFELDTLSMGDALKLFNYFCSIDKDFEDAAKQIIEEFHCHTLAIKLAAIAINKRGYKGDIGSFVGKIKTSKVKIIGEYDNMERTFYCHIKVLFKVFELAKEEIRVLACLSLLPESGISKRYLDEDAEFNLDIDIDIVESLVDSGWIQENGNYGEMISLHPLIAEVAEEELYKDSSLCQDFLSGLTQLANDKHEACGNDIRYIISTVSKKLLNGRTTILEKRNAEKKSFIKLPEAADVLMLSCGICGNTNVRAECLKAAMRIYLSSGNEVNVKKALTLAEKLIYEYINEITANADDVTKCLDLMLEVLPKNKSNRQILLRWFCAAFKAFGKSEDKVRLREYVEKLDKYLSNIYGEYGFIVSCLICGDGLQEDWSDLAKEFYDFGAKRYYELDALNLYQEDPNKREFFENELYDLRDWFITGQPFSKYEEPFQDEQPRLYDIFYSRLLNVGVNILFPTKGIPIYRSPYVKFFEGKSVKEQIDISLNETNSTERAGLLAYAARNAYRENAADGMLICVQEMKKVLDSDISTTPKLLDDISHIIELISNPNDHYDSIEILIEKLIEEHDLVPKRHVMIIGGYTNKHTD